MKKVIRLFLFIFFSVAAMNLYAQNYGDGNSSNSLPDGTPAPATSGAIRGPSSSPLSMTGWHLECNPKIENPELESGKIVYVIEIDSLGDLLTIKIIEKSISDELALKCETELRKMVFVKDSNNTTGVLNSKGKFTFIFRVN